MMMIKRLLLAVCVTVLATGCATRQSVLLSKASAARPVSTVVQMAEDGNSKEMDTHLKIALEKQRVQLKGTNPAGTQKASGVDAVVSYVDQWHWDLVMYLRAITVRLYEASTGDLIIAGNWADSPLHGFRDPQVVLDGLVKEMLERLRTAADGK